MNKLQHVDVVIIGAGAAGLMCAIEGGKRKRSVVVLDHANKAGKKILMSGGGRCNFTNYHIHPDHFISHNPHFCKSALSRYTQWDFIDLVKRYHIPFHEKTLGQLFCDDKSKAILEMLLSECERANAKICLNASIHTIEQLGDRAYKIKTTQGEFNCQSLVIATGGLSIPTMGASPFGYQIAEQFGIPVWPTRAGLVPLTLQPMDKEKFSSLAGIGLPSIVSNHTQTFQENMLFTHRGLSGPAILQISSYWQAGESLKIDLLPHLRLGKELVRYKSDCPQKSLKSVLLDLLPKRVIETFFPASLLEKKISSFSNQGCEQIADQLCAWTVKPNGTEGYRTAEVTLGGVDCDQLSSKTMEVTRVPGLYFIGEVLDVTGWLGGFNFQWAWSSGWAAGQVV